MMKLGVIDSGIGGLTIAKDIIESKLNCEIFYISDSKNVPWGNKSQDFMYERISKMTEILITHQIDSILIACNTATAETINKLRQSFSVNFIGVEPYINYINTDKEASNHRYALILTRATFNSERFKNLVSRLDPNHLVSIYPQNNLAMIIESLKEKPFSEVKDLIDKELQDINPASYTHLILGCTHYPIISKYIQDSFGLKLIDSTKRITSRVEDVLKLSKNENALTYLYYSGNAESIFLKKELKDFHFLYLSDI